MNKIITLTSLLLALLSLAYAIWQKRTLDRKVREVRHERIHPNNKSLEKFTRTCCINIAKQIETNSYSDDEYGDFSLECAVIVLRALAENMPDDVSLADYFDEINRIRFDNLTLE